MAPTIDCSWKQCFGLRVQVALGEISRLNLASGTPSSNGFDWVKADIFQKLFDAVSDQPDMEYVMVDATIVRVHRHGQGAKGGLRARP